MPVWAAILIALLSGGAGAWLTAWNDRHERFRDRMIGAADDLVGAGAGALIAVRDAIYRVDNGLPSDEAIGTAWRERDSVLRLSARVELLFGPRSETAHAANDLASRLAQAIDEIQPPQSDTSTATSRHLEASASLTTLQQAAFKDIQRATPPSATIRESARRVLKR